MPHPLERSVLKTLREQNLAQPGDVGLVAVSGGGDSFALLHLLHALRKKLPFELHVIHFDHGLRQESAQEATWVASQAEALGLPFHLRTATDLGQSGAGVQAAGRDWRQGQCEELLRKCGAQWVATGHHHDDQLETILLKLLRGCHLGGLVGMAQREGPYIRPLLDIAHNRLLGYLRERGLHWLEDPSNRDFRYKRNRVRHELLPLMNDLAGGAVSRRLATLAHQSAGLESLLQSFPPPEQSGAGASRPWISAPQLMELPELAAESALHDFIAKNMPGELEFAASSRAIALLHSQEPAWRLDLSHGRVLRRAGARLMLNSRNAVEPEPEWRDFGRWRIESPACFGLHLADKDCPAERALAIYNLPSDATLRVRRRMNGDRFQPFWKDSPVKLKDFLRDQGIPLWRRDDLPCVVLECQVIAVYPHFVARGYHRPQSSGDCLRLAFDVD